MKNKIIKIGILILLGVILMSIGFNFYLENREKEYFSEDCSYILDEIPNACKEAYIKFETEGLTAEDIKNCPCKDRFGAPLFIGRKFYEIDKDYVGEGCIYHKECEKNEIQGLYYYNKEYDKEDIQNVNIDLDGPSVIRKGNETLFILRILNTNKRTALAIENIRILNFNNETIKESIIKQEIKPIRKEINKLNNIIGLPINKIPLIYILNMQLISGIVPKLVEGSFKPETYKLDIRNFTLFPPKIGETINIFIEVEFSHDDKKFIEKRSHSILISEPLPSPPRD